MALLFQGLPVCDLDIDRVPGLSLGNSIVCRVEVLVFYFTFPPGAESVWGRGQGGPKEGRRPGCRVRSAPGPAHRALGSGIPR